MLMFKQDVAVLTAIRHYLHVSKETVRAGANVIEQAVGDFNSNVSPDEHIQAPIAEIENSVAVINSLIDRASNEKRAASVASYMQLLKEAAYTIDATYVRNMRICSQAIADIQQSTYANAPFALYAIEDLKAYIARAASTQSADDFLASSMAIKSAKLANVLEATKLTELCYCLGLYYTLKSERERAKRYVDQIARDIFGGKEGEQLNAQQINALIEDVATKAMEFERSVLQSEIITDVRTRLEPSDELDILVAVVIPRVLDRVCAPGRYGLYDGIAAYAEEVAKDYGLDISKRA